MCIRDRQSTWECSFKKEMDREVQEEQKKDEAQVTRGLSQELKVDLEQFEIGREEDQAAEELEKAVPSKPAKKREEEREEMPKKPKKKLPPLPARPGAVIIDDNSTHYSGDPRAGATVELPRRSSLKKDDHSGHVDEAGHNPDLKKLKKKKKKKGKGKKTKKKTKAGDLQEVQHLDAELSPSPQLEHAEANLNAGYGLSVISNGIILHSLDVLISIKVRQR
eukprot:TRINITY_DN17740_c0_g1_i3.p1 TRINITY_DN17740_c0_g1~~TRINITY_DN17740_c0_g1_i3.p1  ORF type:complete len:221 (+),score=64.58 TRINITY_DN17740_c0_g1_i3:64-726(+)